MRRAVTEDSYDSHSPHDSPNDDDAPTVPSMPVGSPWQEDFHFHEEDEDESYVRKKKPPLGARTAMVVTCNDCRRRMRKSDRDGRSPFVFLLPAKVQNAR